MQKSTLEVLLVVFAIIILGLAVTLVMGHQDVKITTEQSTCTKDLNSVTADDNYCFSQWTGCIKVLNQSQQIIEQKINCR